VLTARTTIELASNSGSGHRLAISVATESSRVSPPGVIWVTDTSDCPFHEALDSVRESTSHTIVFASAARVTSWFLPVERVSGRENEDSDERIETDVLFIAF
jgi:hypothetical protein